MYLQGVAPDAGNVGGGLGETQSEIRHLQDDALAIQEEAKRLLLTDDCAVGLIALDRSIDKCENSL